MNIDPEPYPDNPIWITAIHEQDTNALHELWNILSNSLYSQEFPIEIIDDAVQISVMKIIDKIDTFSGNSKFTSWAIQIARNSALDILRKRAKANADFIDMFGEESIAWHTERGFEAVGAISMVHDAIDQGYFSERDWHVFLMYNIEGYTGDEVAQEFELSRSNIYTICHRVKKTLETLSYD